METIEHMLFECMIYKDIWEKILNPFGYKFSVQFLIFGNNNIYHQWAFTLVQYLIFKNWLTNKNGFNKKVFEKRIVFQIENLY
jgi:hypothetical protein